MNVFRRDTLRAIRADINAIQRRIIEVRDEEENALAAMPESFQYSSKGEDMEDRIHSMINALDALRDAMNELEEAYA
jgi:NifU-like protein involved in Fe-S cluster formation